MPKLVWRCRIFHMMPDIASCGNCLSYTLWLTPLPCLSLSFSPHNRALLEIWRFYLASIVMNSTKTQTRVIITPSPLSTQMNATRYLLRRPLTLDSSCSKSLNDTSFLHPQFLAPFDSSRLARLVAKFLPIGDLWTASYLPLARWKARVYDLILLKAYNFSIYDTFLTWWILAFFCLRFPFIW